MGTHVDLRQLVIERGGPPAKANRPPRHLVSRYLLPAAIALAFVLVMAWAARDSLLPSTPVTVVPVVVARAEVQAAGAAVAGRLVQRARNELENASAQWEELKQRGPHLRRVAATLRQKRAALARQLELKIDEARLRQAQLAVDAARLNLERTVVRSPAAGRVLRLLASPGTRLAGRSAIAAQDSGHVVSLYDPEQLQVRVDVRLEGVAQVRPGQRVRVETPSAPGPIEGEVLFATSAAKVQKNTLEVKVALKSPPPTIRPEMLVQATFFAVGPPDGAEKAAARQRLLVPRQLVERTEQGAAVWVADAADTARRKTVKPGSAVSAELIEIVEGLQPTDKLISGGRESLRDGQRIRIAGEDQNVGTTRPVMKSQK